MVQLEKSEYDASAPPPRFRDPVGNFVLLGIGVAMLMALPYILSLSADVGMLGGALVFSWLVFTGMCLLPGLYGLCGPRLHARRIIKRAEGQGEGRLSLPGWTYHHEDFVGLRRWLDDQGHSPEVLEALGVLAQGSDLSLGDLVILAQELGTAE